MRVASALLLPAVVLCTLVSCGGDDGSDEAASTSTTQRPPKESSPSSTPASPTGSPGAAGPGQVPRPAPGTCEPVPESPDGSYDLGELGEVTLRVDAPGALTFDVRSGGGWSTSVNSTPGQASVRFTRGEEEVELEGEIEGDRVVIQICDGV